jgi:hypothetical protein
MVMGCSSFINSKIYASSDGIVGRSQGTIFMHREHLKEEIPGVGVGMKGFAGRGLF